MAQVIITINYREYPISCDNGQEIQIMKLGRMLDEKAKALTSSLGHINENQLLAMVGLLLADELSELKKPRRPRRLRNRQPRRRPPLRSPLPQRRNNRAPFPYPKKSYRLWTPNWRKI